MKLAASVIILSVAVFLLSVAVIGRGCEIDELREELDHHTKHHGVEVPRAP